MKKLFRHFKPGSGCTGRTRNHGLYWFYPMVVMMFLINFNSIAQPVFEPVEIPTAYVDSAYHLEIKTQNFSTSIYTSTRSNGFEVRSKWYYESTGWGVQYAKDADTDAAGNIYVITNSMIKKVYGDGTITDWRNITPDGGTYAMKIYDGYLYYAEWKGKIKRIDLNDSTSEELVYTYPNSNPEILGMELHDKYLYIASNADRKILRVDTTTKQSEDTLSNIDNLRMLYFSNENKLIYTTYDYSNTNFFSYDGNVAETLLSNWTGEITGITQDEYGCFFLSTRNSGDIRYTKDFSVYPIKLCDAPLHQSMPVIFVSHGKLKRVTGLSACTPRPIPPPAPAVGYRCYPCRFIC